MNSIISEQIRLAKVSSSSAYQSLEQIESVTCAILDTTIVTAWNAYDRIHAVLTSESALKRYRIMHKIAKEITVISGMILLATWASIQEWSAVEVEKHLGVEPTTESAIEATVEASEDELDEDPIADPWQTSETEFVLYANVWDLVAEQLKIPQQNQCLCLPPAFDRPRLLELATKSGMKVKKNTSTKVLRTKLTRIA